MGGALLLSSALLGVTHVVLGLRLLRAAEAIALGLYAGWWVAAWLARVLHAPACASLLAAVAVPAGQAALVRLAYPHLPMPPQLDAFTSGAQRWLWPLGLLLLLASLHARYASAHRLRPAMAWALLALACAAHGAHAAPGQG